MRRWITLISMGLSLLLIVCLASPSRSASGQAKVVARGPRAFPKDVIVPPLPAQYKLPEFAEAIRRKRWGFVVLTSLRSVGPERRLQERIAAGLSRNQFVPPERLLANQWLKEHPNWVLVGWHASIQSYQQQGGAYRVRLLVSPSVESSEDGIVTILPTTVETWLIDETSSQFLGSETLPSVGSWTST